MPGLILSHCAVLVCVVCRLVDIFCFLDVTLCRLVQSCEALGQRKDRTPSLLIVQPLPSGTAPGHSRTVLQPTSVALRAESLGSGGAASALTRLLTGRARVTPAAGPALTLRAEGDSTVRPA